MTHLPRSRTAHVRTSRGEEGALIAYDLRHDAGHVLNATAAIVYELADGTRTVPDITVVLADRLGAQVDEDVVHLALLELEQAKLLEPGDPVPAPSGFGLGRRDLMRRLALSATAAALLPGLGSVDNLSQAIAPTPRLVGSSGQAGAGYYHQPSHTSRPYGQHPYGSRPGSSRPTATRRTDDGRGAASLQWA